MQASFESINPSKEKWADPHFYLFFNLWIITHLNLQKPTMANGLGQKKRLSDPIAQVWYVTRVNHI